jgi:hypothetical protein
VKQCLSLLLAFSILAPSSFAQESQTGVMLAAPATSSTLPSKHAADGRTILEDGTPVRLRLTRTLSSADCKTGDRIDFEVMDPIVLDGAAAIPQGSIAWGTVTEAEHKKTLGRAGKLNIALSAVKMANSARANLRAVKETQGAGHGAAVTGAVVASAIILWPVAPLFLFIKGKDITIPQGTEITAYVDGDTVFVPVAETVPAPLPVPGLPTSAQQASVAAATELTLVSTPDGADIEVDGAFVGSTPSTITLASGDHTVRVSKKGYQPYEKNLRTSGGKISLHADLDAAVTNVNLTRPARQ